MYNQNWLYPIQWDETKFDFVCLRFSNTNIQGESEVV